MYGPCLKRGIAICAVFDGKFSGRRRRAEAQEKSRNVPAFLLPVRPVWIGACRLFLVSQEGFEPTTHRLEGGCSIQLSY